MHVNLPIRQISYSHTNLTFSHVICIQYAYSLTTRQGSYSHSTFIILHVIYMQNACEMHMIHLLGRPPTHTQISWFHMWFAFDMHTAHLLDKASMILTLNSHDFACDLHVKCMQNAYNLLTRQVSYSHSNLMIVHVMCMWLTYKTDLLASLSANLPLLT